MGPRLLIVSSQVRSVHSGVGTYAGMILEGLLGAGATATIATWTDELAPECYPGFEWISLGGKPAFDPTPGKFWSLGRRLRDALRSRVREFDVVHFLDAREGHAFVRSRLAEGARTIGTVHDDYAARVPCNPGFYFGQAADPLRRFVFHRWQRGIEKAAYPRFGELLVNSAATAAVVAAAYGLDRAAMRPVTLTVPPDVSGDVFELTGAPSLVFVGGNFYRKGLDVVVRALRELREHHPQLELHVVGRCRSGAKIEALARRCGVAQAITFHGQVAPAAASAMIAGASVFVMPSRTEALGLVYLEAFRAGTPVVAGDQGGVVEIVQDGRSGVTVPVDSPPALAAGVLRVLGDPELRERIVAGGREVLAERTPRRLIDETLACYGLATGLSPEPCAVSAG